MLTTICTTLEATGVLLYNMEYTAGFIFKWQAHVNENDADYPYNKPEGKTVPTAGGWIVLTPYYDI